MIPPKLEHFLRHETFLRTLAQHLLRDGRADDVVQETWLVMMRSRLEPDQMKRGWLAGIVRNLVRRVRREETRRARRERAVARSDAEPAADDLLGEEQLRRRLGELVLALPDLYRETILLRFYDGLEPNAIAERMGVKASTVRTRLQRGLQRLRKELERRNGHLAVLLPLALPRREKGVAPALKVAAVLLASLALLWQAAPERDARTARRTSLADARDTGGKAADARGFGRATTGGADGRLDVAATEAIRGTIHLPRGAAPAEVTIELHGDRLLHEGTVPAGGLFAVDATAFPDGLRLTARHPHAETATIEVRKEKEFELRLKRAPVLPVAVEPTSRTKVEPVRLARPPRDGEELPPRVLAGVVRAPFGTGDVTLEVCRGTVCLEADVPSNTWISLPVDALLEDPLPRALVVRASHRQLLPAEARVAVRVVDGEPRLHPFELELLAARMLEGTVRFVDGAPADGATVAAFDPAGPTLFRSVQADDRGRFALAVGTQTTYHVAPLVEGYLPEGRLDDAGPLDFVLGRGATIEGRVEQAGGGGWARLTVTAASPADVEPGLRWDGQGLAWARAEAVTDDEGRYRLGGLAADAYVVEAEALQRTVTAPGSADFVFPSARIDVTVASRGEPVEGAEVRAAGRTRWTDGDGAATLTVPAGRDAVVVAASPGLVPASRNVTPPGAVAFDLEPHSNAATLEVTPSGAYAPAAATFILLTPMRPPLTLRANLTGGRFVLGGLEPGSYRVAALGDDYYYPTETMAVLERASTTKVSLTFLAAGRITVDAQTDVFVWIEGMAYETPGIGDAFFWPGTSWTSGLLYPGRYTIHIEPLDGSRYLPEVRTVTVRKAETARIAVQLKTWR